MKSTERGVRNFSLIQNIWALLHPPAQSKGKKGSFFPRAQQPGRENDS